MSDVIVLTKGTQINLSKADPTLKNLRVSIGWTPNQFSTGGKYDGDVSVFLLNHIKDDQGNYKDAKCPGAGAFLFYNSVNRTADGKTVFRDEGDYPKKGMPATAKLEAYHSGDNTTGTGDGHDESIMVNVPLAMASFDEASFVVTIHDAKEKGQNFGQISNFYVEVSDEDSKKILARYDLSNDFSGEIAVQVGSLLKRKDEVFFKAIGQGHNAGLGDFVKGYGL